MKQTTLCVPLEVKPESCSRLTALLDDLTREEDTGDGDIPANFARIARDIPTLHFMSMSVFTASDYDPLFILEANFDGAPAMFWGQVEATFGDRLRHILRCCKKPLDADGTLYDRVTALDPSASVAAYLEARTQQPSVFHHGNRGLTCDRILQEARLFLSVRTELDDPTRIGPNPYRGVDAASVHGSLRQKLLSTHPWLATKPSPRISTAERIGDLARLLLFVVVVLLAVSLPGLVAAALLPWKVYLLLIAVLAAPILLLIYRKRKARPGTEIPTGFKLIPLLLRQTPLILGYVFAATVLLVPIVLLANYFLTLLGVGDFFSLGTAFRQVASVVLLGLLSLVVTIPLIILWLRFLELRDSSHDAPHVDERLLREMVRREDWVAQNHMGSIVLIKPGVLRTIIIRAGHLGLGLVLRLRATNGYLGSMRTVHFAHWAFLNNGSRLLFFSNFDHSWDSYLDDFIEKAHAGLTLAWGCGVGFPPTNFLVYDGASHGRRFKNWALASRAVSRFWYSAYPTLTVDQIERNNRIANGLCQPTMTQTEASAWIRDL